MMRAVSGDGRVTETEIASESPAGQRHRLRPQKSAKPLRPRFAVLGLYAAHGRVGADVIPNAHAEGVRHMLRGRNGRQSIARSGVHSYAAVVYRGRLYRLAESGAGRAPFGQIEAFWAYLQRQLRAKGGIRRERLGLYLAEFAWRYNHRKLSSAEQVRELLALIRQPIKVE
jgi:transposase-like protein